MSASCPPEAVTGVFVAAQQEARQRHHSRIGTEHLLLGILADHTGPGGTILADAGMTLAATRQAVIDVVESVPDAEALQRIGIDLDRVRRAVEASFGEGALDRGCRGAARAGHIPFSPRAKKSLELSLREALRLGDRHIGTEHLLLGLLREGKGLAATLLDEAGVDRTAVQAAVIPRSG